MRRVVDFDASVDIVDITRITDSSSIGVKWSNDRKSIVIQMDEENFGGVSVKSLNASYTWRTKTKQEYAVRALKQEAEVFAFASQKELLIWAIKES